MYTRLSQITLMLCNHMREPAVISQMMNCITICLVYVLL